MRRPSNAPGTNDGESDDQWESESVRQESPCPGEKLTVAQEEPEDQVELLEVAREVDDERGAR
jgi:hypothetical protein